MFIHLFEDGNGRMHRSLIHHVLALQEFTPPDEIIDMPDRRASRFVQFRLQNGGILARRKREEFAEPADDEVPRLQNAIQEIMAEPGAASA